MMLDAQPERRSISWIVMYLICWLVRADPEILAGCPTIDKFYVVSRALLLLVTACIALFTWGGFWGQFWPAHIAVPLTVLVVFWVLLTDQIMAAARLHLTDILKGPNRARMFGVSAVIRLTLGIVTSTVTSYSATLLLCHESVIARLEQNLHAENARRQITGESEKTEKRAALLGSFDNDLRQATADFSALRDRIKAAEALRDTANTELLNDKLKANCEALGGHGCHRGQGPEWQAARIREKKAREDSLRADADIAALQPQLSAAEAKRDAAASALHAAEGRFETEVAAKIDARVKSEVVPFRNDPLLSFRALNQLFDSPEDGAAARFYWHLLMALLLVMELSYIASSDWLKPASVYEARLIARTEVLAAEAAAQFRRLIAALFGDDGDAPPKPRKPPPRLLRRFGDDGDNDA